VNAYLEQHQLLADPPFTRLGRAEWRYLQTTGWSDDIERQLRRYLEEVAERIFQMVRVAGIPDPRVVTKG
jgi:hypothetical protein